VKLQESKLEIEKQLADRRIELASPDVVRHYVRDLRRVLEVSEIAEKKAFIRSFVKRISVTGKEGAITYTIPINGTLEQKIGALPTVKYGGR